MTAATKPRSARTTGTQAGQAGELAGMDPALPDHDRQAMIAVAAFFIAESRGFAPGQEFDDWLAAERMLAQQPDSNAH